MYASLKSSYLITHTNNIKSEVLSQVEYSQKRRWKFEKMSATFWYIRRLQKHK